VTLAAADNAWSHPETECRLAIDAGMNAQREAERWLSCARVFDAHGNRNGYSEGKYRSMALQRLDATALRLRELLAAFDSAGGRVSWFTLRRMRWVLADTEEKRVELETMCLLLSEASR
jgi:hypothetical protein